MFKNILSAVFTVCLMSSSGSVFASQPAKTDQAGAQLAQADLVVDMVNINTADAATIEAGLVGIGKVKAQAIVDYRQAHGPFASIDELLEVKGIGEATLEKNRDRLSAN